MKEIEFRELSLGHCKKEILKSKIAEEIIVSALFAFMPILGVLITKDYTVLSTCILIPFFVSLVVSTLKDEFFNTNWEREYKIWLSSKAKKQRRRQDCKFRKWLM